MIKGTHLFLRAPEIEDIPLLYRWENDPEVQAYSSIRVPVSSYAIEQYILSAGGDPFAAGQVRLMAVVREGNTTVGHIDLFEIDGLNRRAGIGILVDKEFRGSGYASEMLEIMAAWCAETLQLHQLWCSVGADNAVSLQLFINAGFVLTGKRLQWSRGEDGWKDEVFMQKVF